MRRYLWRPRLAAAHQRPWGPLATPALWTAAYLYGSTPLIYWLGRRARVDLRAAGSGNVGATNLLQHGGRRGKALALVGWLFDASKGAAPSAVALALGASPTAAALAGALGAVGQCWPAPLRFRGGRGISAFVGAAALMDPIAWAVSLLPMIAGGVWRVAGRRWRRASAAPATAPTRPDRSRSVPLGCFVGVALFPVVCAARGGLTGSSRARLALIGPITLSTVILVRRLTAPLPDDAIAGPRKQARALVYRLLYDRNTAD